MARAVSRVGEYFGHAHDDLRIKSDYQERAKEISAKAEGLGQLEELLKAPGISRTEY